MHDWPLPDQASHRAAIRVWIDIDNAPHVEIFRPIVERLEHLGHACTITVRDHAYSTELLELHSLRYTCIGRHYGKQKLKKVFGSLVRALRICNRSWTSRRRNCAADVIYYLLNEDHPYSFLNAPNNAYLAVASGRPLITYPRGEAGRIVSLGAGVALQEATLPELEKAVSHLLDPEAWQTFHTRAVELQQRYSWTRAEKNLLKAYEYALGDVHVVSATR